MLAESCAWTHRSTSKYATVNMCTDDRGSTCTDISTDITGVNGSTYQYTYTKGTGVRRVTSMDDSTVNTVIRGRINAYEKYGR